MESTRVWEHTNTHYNIQVKHALSKLISQKKRIATTQAQRIFLQSCRNSKVIPTHIDNIHIRTPMVKHTRSKRKQEIITAAFKRKLIKVEIEDTYRNENLLLKEHDKTLRYLATLVNDSDRTMYTDFLSRISQKTKNRKLQQLQNKLNRLHERTNSHTHTLNLTQNITHTAQEKWVKNLTNTDIPKNIMEVLALGPKFSIPYNRNNLPITDIIASVETCIDKLDKDTKNKVRSEIVNNIIEHKHKMNHINRQNNNLFRQIKQTKTFLKENEHILITRADKGNVTVVINKAEYENKMYEQLQDTTTYLQLKSDPTLRVQTDINNLIKKWIRKGYLTEQTGKNMMNHASVIPKIYGLPKIHKENYPLRPIVSCINSPTYKLSKFISKLLQPTLGKTKYDISNSFQFAKEITQYTIPNNNKLISFDVVSLYTNLESSLILKCIKRRWAKIRDTSPIPLKELLEAVSLCLNSTYFSFKGQVYKQVFGSPMGSPVSATLANLTMEYVVSDLMRKSPYKPVFLKRYVDDIILELPEDKIDTMLEHFNSYNTRLKFTHELENNNTISFLDILLINNNNGKIAYKWYKKPTSSGRYLNYRSHHPPTQKTNLVSNTVDRALKLSDGPHRPEALKIAETDLLTNNYPQKLIQSQIQSRTQILYNSLSKKEKEKPKTPSSTTTLPYVEGLGQKIKRTLGTYNIRTVFKTPLNLYKTVFSKIKDTTPKEMTSNVVYKIPCLFCDLNYIGQTKQTLKNRITGHKSNMKQHTSTHTALTKHTIETDHIFDYKETEILEIEPNYKKRLIKEMIHIHREQTVNLKTDTNNLSNIYLPLIDTKLASNTIDLDKTITNQNPNLDTTITIDE